MLLDTTIGKKRPQNVDINLSRALCEYQVIPRVNLLSFCFCVAFRNRAPCWVAWGNLFACFEQKDTAYNDRFIADTMRFSEFASSLLLLL